jgi:CubicO group peptidase (beta-lactamase class C family)
MNKAAIEGTCDPKFQAAADIFQRNFDTSADIGASFCATVEGEVVVDLWGGFADEARTRPWMKDTIVNVYSTTKTMTVLTALLLADRGLIDFDAPVARYWPEFAAAGKDAIKVSHLLSHSSGLSGWRQKVSVEDLYDWDKVCALLASQEPFWTPGTAFGYHALTQGNLIGEVVRRVTGKSLGTVFREEIADVIHADFHIGLRANEDHRVAELIPPPAPPPTDQRMSELTINALTNPPIDPADTRTRAWRAAEIPAAGGHGNARSIARTHAILANGGVAQGMRFMSESGCRKALEPQIEGIDLVLGMPIRFGLGFGLNGELVRMKNQNSLFWGGYGGSLAIIDMDARTTFGYAMNKMGSGTVGDSRSLDIINAMWSAM